ncbi:MAG: pyridoxal phosphate-dependent aminotransferase, partial [Turicibacter sp.]
IHENLHQRLATEHIGYSNHYGLLELRIAIATHCKNNYQQDYDPQSELIITTGCSESISAVMGTLINKGDEVLIFEPAFSLYKSIVEMYGGTVITYNMHQNHGKINREKLDALLTPKVKAMIVNSPNNPSGQVLTENDIETIYTCVKDKKIFMVTDEIYRDLIFDDISYHSFSKFESIKNRLFILNGVSKSFAMTGWRVGYVLGPKEYMKTVAIVHQNLVASTSTISQYAAIEALKHPEITKHIKETYELNRNYVYEQLKPYFEEIIYPQGAFYLYLNVSIYHQSSMAFAMALLENQKVALVPCLAFENEDYGYVRLSYCCELNVLKEGVIRIQNFVKSM